MLAVDTNVVVRYVTRDHPEQSPRAKALIDGNDVLLATTVLLETEWVLRSAYGFDRAEMPRRCVHLRVCRALLLRIRHEPSKHWIGSPVEWISPTRCISPAPSIARHSSVSTGPLSGGRSGSRR